MQRTANPPLPLGQLADSLGNAMHLHFAAAGVECRFGGADVMSSKQGRESLPIYRDREAPLHILICYPFLDLRFLTRADISPPRPQWPYGGFSTVGELGPIVALADGSGEAEIRVNAAVHFPQEYQREHRPRRRRWRKSPPMGDGISVAGRRLLADDAGQVRIEIMLSVADGTAPAKDAPTFFDGILATSVEVVNFGKTELLWAGFHLAESYLRNSAKTAEQTQYELLNGLLREGTGSPFLVIVRPALDGRDPDGVALEPPHPAFLTTTCSLLELGGRTLGVWQLWGEGTPRTWLPHVRALCRIVSHLSEVTLLAGLQRDPHALAPYLLDAAATEHFFRKRQGQLWRKHHDGWFVASVQARAVQHIKVAIDEKAAFMEDLQRLVRRDVANDIAKILAGIKSNARDVPLNVIQMEKVYMAQGDIVGRDKTEGDKVVGNKTTQTAGGDIVGGNKNVQMLQDVRSELAPVAAQIESAPPDKRDQARQELAKIEAEAAQGKKANDHNLANLIEGLVDLVPQAASAMVAAFGGPTLSAVAGVITKYVIDKIQRRP